MRPWNYPHILQKKRIWCCVFNNLWVDILTFTPKKKLWVDLYHMMSIKIVTFSYVVSVQVRILHMYIACMSLNIIMILSVHLQINMWIGAWDIIFYTSVERFILIHIVTFVNIILFYMVSDIIICPFCFFPSFLRHLLWF